MQGERAVAIGLSLTLHTCLLATFVLHLALTPSLTSRPPIIVSFEAPPSIAETVGAVSPREIPPSGEPAALATIAPMPARPLSEAPVLSAPTASALSDKGAELELQPRTTLPASRVPDRLGPSLPALPGSAGQMVQPTSPVSEAKPVQDEDQASSAATAPQSLPATSVGSEAEALAMVANEQAAAEAAPVTLNPETTPQPQLPAVDATSDLKPRLPEIRVGSAVGQAIPPSVPAAQILADTPPPAVSQTVSGPQALLTVPSPLIASALPLADPTASRPGPDVVRDPSPLSSQSVASTTSLVPTEMPRETVTASLPSPAPGQAIDLGTPDVPPSPTDAERTQKIRAFVDRYDGGPCFFAAVRQVSATSAEIESFATLPETFQQFDRALKTSTGIEALVSGQRIWSAQCSAVEYLRRLTHDTDTGPSLVLERRALDSGEALSGTIRGATGRPLRLFVVAETGTVTDISDAVSEHDGNPSFSFRPQLSTSGGPFPQILVLVAGKVTLPLHPMTADDIFKPLIAFKGADYTVAAKMFLASR